MLNKVGYSLGQSRLISGKTLILFTFLFLLSYNAYSQDITNTLGTNGEFIITDGSNTFLTVDQTNGLITLSYSIGSTNGSIFKGTDRFLHTYAPSGADGKNTFLGINAGNFDMSGIGVFSSYNTGIGHSSLFSNTTGSGNTAVGYSSLFSNTYSGYNTAVGFSSLYSNTDGYYNTAMGWYSLYSNTSGSGNTAVGYTSLRNNTTGDDNTALGFNSLYRNTTGVDNTAVGYSSLAFNNTGYGNTAVGIGSLFNNSTGYWNTAIGDSSGVTLTTGYNNTLIGHTSQPSSGTVNNEITLGNGLVTSLRCNVPYIASLSDARDKNNISDLSLGLDFITRLKPRQFNWDRRDWYEDNKSDGSKTEDKLTAGFIAQELDEVQQSENAEWLELVYKSNPEKLEATTGNLLPVMVKAIQELNDKNETLLTEIEQLKNEIESLKTVNEKLVKLEKLIMEIKENESEIKKIKSGSN